jgi:hypothetical protein
MNCNNRQLQKGKVVEKSGVKGCTLAVRPNAPNRIRVTLVAPVSEWIAPFKENQ